MSKIQIMTDSVSDIPISDEEKYSISVLPYPITIGDKVYISRVDLTDDEFYALMSRYDEIPKTSQITPFQFKEIYHREAEAGVTDLIIVLINSEGSSTYQNSLQAIDMFYEEYPEYKDKFHIYSFDSGGYNAMYGVPVVRAAQMRDEGASVDEILGYLTDILPRRQVFFGIYDLKYAARSGRIPSAAAFLGTKLNLKPIMKIYDHSITTAAKCRGEHNLMTKLVEMTAENIEPGTPYVIACGQNTENLEELRTLMVQSLGYGPEAVYRIGSVIAVNSGPIVIGTAFTRKKDI